MDATSHTTTLFPTVSGRQPRALVPHPTLRLLGESAHSASSRPNSACRNVKHKRRCRLHLFRGPCPTLSLVILFSDFSADGACRFAPHTKTASPFRASVFRLGASFDGSTWPPLAVSSVFHLGESMSCSWGHMVSCQVLCDNNLQLLCPVLVIRGLGRLEQKPLVFELTLGHPGNQVILFTSAVDWLQPKLSPRPTSPPLREAGRFLRVHTP